MKLAFLWISIAMLFSGCTTKAVVSNGERYTQNTFSSEWEKDNNFSQKTADNATKPEEAIGSAAGKATATAVAAGAMILLSPIGIAIDTANAIK